jgi:hypothetical protein
MSASTTTSAPQALPLQNEWEMFQDLLTRLLDGILNRVFALTINGSRQRRALLFILLLILGALLYLGTLGFDPWINFLGVFIKSLLTGETSIQVALKILLNLLWDARVMRLLPMLILPYIFAREFASRYLADIFELDESIEELRTARQFINEVSLGGADNHLTVNVDTWDDDETKLSPIRRIGGPGRVSVALGTAILVERPDGFPRVIGPLPLEEEQERVPASAQLQDKLYQKGDRWHVRRRPRSLLPPRKKKPEVKRDKYVLEGFERIREPIDLRVQMPEALEINARSRDGIPIRVIDARVVFTISRGIRVPTLKEPYPYTEAAIRAMIYKKPKRVVADPKLRSVWDTQTTIMKALLRKEMGEFMSRHELSEYLATIGLLETDAIKKIDQDISTEKKRISGQETQSTRNQQTTSPRKPRTELSRLFSDFSGKFNQEQKKRGVEAQWVGVGTWKMPPGIPEKVIPQKHLTAWQITLENQQRGSEHELGELELNARAEGIQRLISQAPLNAFRETQNPGLNLNRARINLVTAYWQQLHEAIENLSRLGEHVPPKMVAADFKLQLIFSHPIYPNIPAPASPREKKLYGELLKRVKIHQAIEKMIELERPFAPNASRAELMERIIKAWDADA